MSQISFHFFCHTGKTVIAFRKQWYNGNFIQKAVVYTPLPRVTPGLHHWLCHMIMCVQNLK